MGDPHQPFVGFAMLFAMVLPEQYHWLLVRFHAFLENDFGFVVLLIALYALYCFAEFKVCSSDESVRETQTKKPDTQDYAAEVMKTGEHAKECQSNTLTHAVEAVLGHVVLDTGHPLRQTIDKLIYHGITTGLRDFEDKRIKCLEDELFAAKAELITVKDELVAVMNELSTSKEKTATNNTMVAPPQEQINEIREQIREDLLAELRKDMAEDIYKEFRKYVLRNGTIHQHVDDLRAELRDQRHITMDLPAKVDEIQTKMQHLVEQLDTASKEQSRSTTALATNDLPASASIDAQSFSTLQEEVNAQRSRLSNALAALGELKASIHTSTVLSDQQKVIKNDIAAIQKQLAEQTDRLSGLDTSVDTIIQQQMEEDGELTNESQKKTDEEAAGLQSRIEDIKTLLTEQGSVPKQIEDLQLRTNRLEDDTEQHKRHLKQLEHASAHLDSLNQHMAELRLIIPEMRREVNTAAEQITVLQNIVPDMRSKLDSATQDIQQHEGRLRKELKKYSCWFTQDDKSIRGLDDRVSRCETNLGIEAPQHNRDAEEGCSSDVEVKTSSDDGRVVAAPATEGLPAASIAPVGCAEEAVIAPRPSGEEVPAPAPSTEHLQSSSQVFKFIVPAGGRVPDLPRGFEARQFSQSTFTFTPTLELAVSSPRVLKACRSSSHNTAPSPTTSTSLLAPSSIELAPPQDSATTSTPLFGASDGATEPTALHREQDVMDLDAYDQSEIPDDQEEAEDFMATAGDERPDSPDTEEFEQGSDEDAEGEDDDEEYGYSYNTFEQDAMVTGEEERVGSERVR